MNNIINFDTTSVFEDLPYTPTISIIKSAVCPPRIDIDDFYNIINKRFNLKKVNDPETIPPLLLETEVKEKEAPKEIPDHYIPVIGVKYQLCYKRYDNDRTVEVSPFVLMTNMAKGYLDPSEEIYQDSLKISEKRATVGTSHQ